jgi:plasmid stability protein
MTIAMEAAMASMVIRNISEDLMNRLKETAKREGKSAEQIAREALADRVKPSRDEIIRRMDEIRSRSKPVDLETARRLWAEHIRERDERPFDPTFHDDH